MSAPSASRQAALAQNRSIESFKQRLDTLERLQKDDIERLTHSISQAESEIKSLRDSNIRLARANEDYAKRIEALEAYKSSLELDLKIIHKKISYESSRVDVAQADIKQIAPGLTIKSYNSDPAIGVDEAQYGGPVATSGPATVELATEAQAATVRSLAARDADELKDAVASTLYSLYRVNSFNNIADRHYPHVPEDHDDWPHSTKPDGTRDNFMRLNFEENHDSATNEPLMTRWRDAVRNIGAHRVPGAEPYLKVIGDDHLMERIIKKFKYEQRTYRAAMKGSAIPTKNRTESGELVPPPPVVQPNPEPLSAEEIAAKTAELASMSTATRQSFQKSLTPISVTLKKRDVRARKRPGLKGEAAKYLDSSYDTILTVGAQSEDDYEVESVNGHEPRKTGKLVAREWWFASKDLKACKSAIDAVVDPNPPKKAPMPVVRGPDRPGSPRRNITWANRMFRWQIDPEILAKNPKWIESGRVLENDATEVPAGTSKKRKAPENTQVIAGPSTQGQQARLKLEDREKKLKLELGNATYDQYWELDDSADSHLDPR
ncbi:hypothetical protein RhiJN_09538 [Ceratobasidium sp. AG-Ba]|nr:hypothetical protein RhiJN_09538 [Ceratobasidium sp. AG-Ba]